MKNQTKQGIRILLQDSFHPKVFWYAWHILRMVNLAVYELEF